MVDPGKDHAGAVKAVRDEPWGEPSRKRKHSARAQVPDEVPGPGAHHDQDRDSAPQVSPRGVSHRAA